jgi:hypothetical protein
METRRDNQPSRCFREHSPSFNQRQKSDHQTPTDMSKEVIKIINQGSGPYQLTKEQAGEAYRAARKIKTEFTTFWNRKRRKATK